MEKSTTKEFPSFKKVVAGCGLALKKVKPPTTIVCNKGVWTYKRLKTNTDDEMAD
nr:putative 4c protein [Infectious bronchitis virus]WNR61956.1 putative 4c protein [Infectious bronchitis virus]